MTTRDQFMPFATKDLALFHTTMFLSAAHLILLDQTFPACELFYHGGQPLHCISERLSNPKQRSADSNICAIACFAQLESYWVSTGTVEGIRVYMKGLEKLAQMRGGLFAIRSNAFLYRQLTWVDLQASIRLQWRPHIKPMGLIQNDPLAHSTFLLPAILHLKSGSERLNLPSTSINGNCDYYDKLMQVCQGLCFLSNLKTLAASLKNTLFLDKLYFSDKFAVVGRRAQLLKYIESKADTYLLRAFSEASLIVIYSVLQDYPDGSALPLDLQQQLRASLSKLPFNTLAASLLAQILWMLLVDDLVRQAGLELAEEEILGAIDGLPWGNCTAANGRGAMWRELEGVEKIEEKL